MGLFDAFSTQPAQDAAAAQIAGITQGAGVAMPNLQAAIQQLQQTYGGQAVPALQRTAQQALSPFQSLLSTGQAGVDQLKSLLGFGPSGTAGIQQTLQNLPGYQFQLQQ